MNHRRQTRPLAALLTALCLGLAPLAAQAQAQEYPSKQITFVVASVAGGILDTVGRIVAHGLEKMGQTVVVQNIPGAGSTMGTAAVANAPADGYTIGMVATSHAINPSVYPKLPYDTQHDFVTISHAVNLTNVLVVHPSVAANSLAEFIALAKAKPGEINCGSAGSGQSNHLSLEMFNAAAGVKLVHIPYKGSAPAMVDLVGGVIGCMFVDALSAAPYIKAGKLKGLAVTSATRVPALPELPTFAESGMPNFSGSSWLAVVVRAGTPKKTLDKLSNATMQVMKDPQVRERLIAMGIEPVGAPMDPSARFMQTEISRYAEAVKNAGVKLDN